MQCGAPRIKLLLTRELFLNALTQVSISCSSARKKRSSSTRENMTGAMTCAAHFSFYIGSQASANWSVSTVPGLNMMASFSSEGTSECSPLAWGSTFLLERSLFPMPLAIRPPSGYSGFSSSACSAAATTPPITPRLWQRSTIQLH